MPRHHHFDFIEICTTDLVAAKKFYGDAFGWTFQDWGDDYADIQGAGISGGLRKVEEAPPARGGTLAILYSQELAGSEQAVAAAGGMITERHEFPGGRRFHFVDPTGAELAVWTKVDAAEAEPPKPKPKARAKAKPAKAKAKPAKAKPAKTKPAKTKPRARR